MSPLTGHQPHLRFASRIFLNRFDSFCVQKMTAKVNMINKYAAWLVNIDWLKLLLKFSSHDESSFTSPINYWSNLRSRMSVENGYWKSEIPMHNELHIANWLQKSQKQPAFYLDYIFPKFIDEINCSQPQWLTLNARSARVLFQSFCLHQRYI